MRYLLEAPIISRFGLTRKATKLFRICKKYPVFLIPMLLPLQRYRPVNVYGSLLWYAFNSKATILYAMTPHNSPNCFAIGLMLKLITWYPNAFTNLSNFVKRQIHLPIKLGGISVRRQSTLRWNEYMGGIMEGVVPLLDKQKDDRFLKGKLEVDHIGHWIGNKQMVGINWDFPTKGQPPSLMIYPDLDFALSMDFPFSTL